MLSSPSASANTWLPSQTLPLPVCSHLPSTELATYRLPLLSEVKSRHDDLPELADPDLGSLQILQDAHRHPQFFFQHADGCNSFRVLLMRAV